MRIKGIHKYLGILMLVGLSLAIIGFITGGAKYSMYMDHTGFHVDDETDWRNIHESDLDKFTSIDIDTNFSTVEFVKSDKYGFEINYSARHGNPVWTLNDGILKINDSPNASNFIRFINIDIVFWDFAEEHRNYVKVYLPKDISLDEVLISVKSGDIILGDFSSNNTEITNYFGSIKLENITSADFNIELKSGDFNGKSLSGGNIIYKNDFGSGTFDGLTSDALSAAVSSGKFELANGVINELDVKNNFGNIIVNNSDIKNSDINIDSGDVRLSGDFTGRTSINSSFGSVYANLTRAKEYYNINLSTSLGDVKVDNNRMGNNVTLSEGGKGNLLKIKNSCGDIAVNFSAD